MEPASIEQALQYCLENPDNLSTDELLSKFPRYRDELESLLAFDKQLGSSLPLQMPAESKALVKQRIVNRVAAGRPDHAPEKEAPAMEQVAANAPASGKPWWRRSLFTGVAALVLLAVLWWGAATSLPDNPLYPVKLGTQNFFLNFAGGSTALIRGHLDLGNMRLVDIRSMQAGNALDKAGPALDDYNYHLANCLNLWQQRNDDADVDLAKLIYASSVAGQRTLAMFGDTANALPEQLRSNVRDTTTTIDKLQTGSSKILHDANVDLEPVLKEVGGALGSLLVPGPGTPSPTTVAVAVPTGSLTTSPSIPSALPTGTRVASIPDTPGVATLTAVLIDARTVVAGSGTDATPGVAAAQTVVASRPGDPMSTPVADAVRTILAQPSPTPSVEVSATPTGSPTTPASATPQPTVTPEAATKVTPSTATLAGKTPAPAKTRP